MLNCDKQQHANTNKEKKIKKIMNMQLTSVNVNKTVVCKFHKHCTITTGVTSILVHKILIYLIFSCQQGQLGNSMANLTGLNVIEDERLSVGCLSRFGMGNFYHCTQHVIQNCKRALCLSAPTIFHAFSNLTYENKVCNPNPEAKLVKSNI